MNENNCCIPAATLADYAQGRCSCVHRFFGAQPGQEDGQAGVRFTVWVPGAAEVGLTGDWLDWATPGLPLQPVGDSGIWSLFLPGMQEGALYKYYIRTQSGKSFLKADPVAFGSELRPGTASRITQIQGFCWKDGAWMYRRGQNRHAKRPMNIYEVHLGSWKQHAAPRPEPQAVPPAAFYSYRQLAQELLPYVKDMGYTHIELLPLMEHPLDASWGYQITGFFAPTSRYGTAEELQYFINECHRQNIGVILDWVPGHFCRDAHGLGRFNGEMLYEARDHQQWGTYIFDFARGEVRSFLLSSAAYWLETFHADGLRVDGVSAMLYLNYGQEPNAPLRYNREGGQTNLEAISLLRELNTLVHAHFPGVFTVAEEATAWPKVTQPPAAGGLGFDYKWDMGWMNDTLRYMQTDFPYRPGCHNQLTFSMMYAFSERFILPLSHDEVVHGKCSLIGRMPGDYWRQFAGLRLLALYQMTHPGGKLNFMGSEFGQFIEWRDYEALEWFLLKYPQHDGHRAFIRALNHLYLEQASLWQQEDNWAGYTWLDADNAAQSVLLYLRQGLRKRDSIIVAINFNTDSYGDYRIGVPHPGLYTQLLNSDAACYGGSGYHDNPAPLAAEKRPLHGQPYSLCLRLPALGGVILRLLAPGKAKSNA